MTKIKNVFAKKARWRDGHSEKKLYHETTKRRRREKWIFRAFQISGFRDYLFCLSHWILEFGIHPSASLLASS
jgi:hypothetical protein